ncbi:MAG: hypothetical protein CL571_01000 [Alphaproteobacteria bacterium]|nr:hypothetical protein [Alphaproteobacteria bacterium]
MLTKKINKKQVVEYLLKNPDFFCETPKILSELNFPVGIGTKSKNVVSFKDWVISNLKSQKEEIIENARHNYFTQQKIHEAVIEIIKKKEREEFLMFLNKKLPKLFDLSVVNLITSNQQNCKEFKLIHMNIKNINKMYNSKNFLLMDAYDDKLGINSDEKIYSNAIFSLDENCLSEKMLLFFGSKDNRFITNRAYDLIFFLSKIIEQKLKDI